MVFQSCAVGVALTCALLAAILRCVLGLQFGMVFWSYVIGLALTCLLFLLLCAALFGLQVGMVFQSYALFNHMTVAENIKFGLQVGG
jgi:hypothetical protein